MIRTQIQLPDEDYARARKVCERREISFAKLSRRGLDSILSVDAPEPGTNKAWQPPKPRRLGRKGLTDSELKDQAQIPNAETFLVRRRKN